MAAAEIETAATRCPPDHSQRRRARASSSDDTRCAGCGHTKPDIGDERAHIVSTKDGQRFCSTPCGLELELAASAFCVRR